MKLHPSSVITRAIIGTALVTSLSSISASANTVWWEARGSTATNNWSDATNWSTTAAGDGPAAGSIPEAGDDLIFNTTGNNGTRTVTLAQANRTARSLTIRNTGSTTFASGYTSGTTFASLTIGEGGVTVLAGSGNVSFGSGDAWSVPVRLSASQTWTNNSTSSLVRTFNSVASTVTGDSSLTFAGVGNFSISNAIQAGAGTLAVIKNGTGTLTLSGNNLFTGGLTLNEGIVSMASTGNFGATNGTLTFGGGTLRTTATLSSGRLITLNAEGGTVETATGTVFTQSAGLSGSGGLTKTGAGTLLLTSNVSSYAGNTTVSAGKLLINGNQSGATGAVTVASGATLGGTGTIGGATTISGIHAVGGTSAGADSISTQTFSSGLSYATGSAFNWQLGSQATTGPGTNFDKVTVGGELNISTGANFNIYVTGLDLNSAFWTTTQTWDVFDAGSTVGSFANFTLYDAASPTIPVLYGSKGYFSYIPSTGSLQWAVPEPSNALAGLLIAAGLLRRRRAPGGI